MWIVCINITSKIQFLKSILKFYIFEKKIKKRACSQMISKMSASGLARVVAIGGPANQTMDISSYAGGNVLKLVDL